MPHRALCGSLALLLPTLILACVQGGDPAYKVYCRTMCDVEHNCRLAIEQVTTPATLRQCQRECMLEPANVGTRHEVLDAVGVCLTERNCEDDAAPGDAVLTEDGEPVLTEDGEPVFERWWIRSGAVDACLGEALEGTDSTKACEDYCDDLRVALDGCAVTEAEATCRARVCRFTPDSFASGTCLDESECDELQTCVAAGLP